MIHQPLLTICIPTFNRCVSLSLLLLTLREELQGLQNQVEVLVSDNASTDETASTLDSLIADWSDLRIRRNQKNLGPESNFLTCLEEVHTRYCWFIADDDLPKPGVIRRILKLLNEMQPALVYMQSEWVAPLTHHAQGKHFDAIRAEAMDSLGFVQRVHAWLTFISGIVFDRSALKTALRGEAIDRFNGTSLVQLGWVLPLLRLESRCFVFIPETCILATKGNSGGYPLLTVFGQNLTHIAQLVFGPDTPLSRALIRGNVMYNLPLLIWSARTSSFGSFEKENPWPGLHQAVRGHSFYWLLLMPLGRFPFWAANYLFQLWRVFSRLGRESLRWRIRPLQIAFYF
jgi:glycosyltransferase involved in cell wall biosynthesis